MSGLRRASRRPAGTGLVLGLLMAALPSALSAQALDFAPATQWQLQQQSLQQTVQALESTGDIWHPRIAESMTSLGLLLQQAGRHEEALSALERAAQINRVNHGLFSLEQSQALAMQIDSHLALDKWDDADRLMREHFYIHVRAQPDGGAALIPALLDYADWHLQSFVDYRVPFRMTRLIDAYQLYRVIVSTVQAAPDYDPLRYEHYLRQIAFIAWRMSRISLDIPSDILNNNSRQVNDTWVDHRAPDMLPLRNNSLLMGENALKQLVASTQQRLEAAVGDTAIRAALRDDITARLHLADWYLYANKRRQAVAEYQRIRQTLVENDSTLVDELFGKVVMLPAFEYRLQSEADDAFSAMNSAGLRSAPATSASGHTGWPWVDIEFDLTRYGRVSRAEIVAASTELSEELRRQILTEMNDALLRPLITENGAQSSQAIVYRFLYHPDRLGGADAGDDDDLPAAVNSEEAAIETETTEAQ